MTARMGAWVERHQQLSEQQRYIACTRELARIREEAGLVSQPFTLSQHSEASGPYPANQPTETYLRELETERDALAIRLRCAHRLPEFPEGK